MLSVLVGCTERNLLEELVRNEDHRISQFIENKDKYELQIIYTRVINKEDKKILKTYTYNENADKYFYPASTVKFPAAVLALEKLNELNLEGVNKFTHLSIDSVFEGHVSFTKDHRTDCGYPNIADYIKEIFIVSDNEAFNRLYDFLGQKEINDRMIRKGFSNTNIIHRLSVTRTPKQNMETNPINFYNEKGEILYMQPARIESTNVNLDLQGTLKGKGYFLEGELINEPMDFSFNNFFSLRDQHNLLIRIMMPERFDKNELFNLNYEDYKFLKEYMCKLPRESECPKYNAEKYFDGHVKFLMFGDSKDRIPDNIKIYSKSGLAYGYLTDNAYIVDNLNNIEFFLSATIHVNENQIYNDDNYEYDEIGLPFLAELGKIIYEYELNDR